MRPLEGMTVVSLEQAIAAPYASRQLADLGARVVKIERPGSGDFARGYDERVRGMASHFVWTNRSKESLTLDVKHARASEVLERLLARADVLVQNLAPGAAARLGLDPARIDVTSSLNTVYIWNLVNNSGEMHPFHKHLAEFNVLSLGGGAPPAAQSGWKDTVAVPDRGSAQIIFKNETFPGTFVFHCHRLEHEDHRMMLQEKVQ